MERSRFSEACEAILEALSAPVSTLNLRRVSELTPEELLAVRQYRRTIMKRANDRFRETHGYSRHDAAVARSKGMTPEEYVASRAKPKPAVPSEVSRRRARNSQFAMLRSAMSPEERGESDRMYKTFRTMKCKWKKDNGIDGKFTDAEFLAALKAKYEKRFGVELSMERWREELSKSPRAKAIVWAIDREFPSEESKRRAMEQKTAQKMAQISDRGTTAFGTAMTERGARQLELDRNPEAKAEARALRRDVLRARRNLPPEMVSELRRAEQRARYAALSNSEKELIRAKAQARYYDAKQAAERNNAEPQPEEALENYIMDNLDSLLVECNMRPSRRNWILEAVGEMSEEDRRSEIERDMERLSGEEYDEERECGLCGRVFSFNRFRPETGSLHAKYGALCPDCTVKAMEMDLEESGDSPIR